MPINFNIGRSSNGRYHVIVRGNPNFSDGGGSWDCNNLAEALEAMIDYSSVLKDGFTACFSGDPNGRFEDERLVEKISSAYRTLAEIRGSISKLDRVSPPSP